MAFNEKKLILAQNFELFLKQIWVLCHFINNLNCLILGKYFVFLCNYLCKFL